MEVNIAHIATMIANYISKKKFKLSDFLPCIKSKREVMDKKQGSDFMKQLSSIVKGVKK